MSVGPAKAADLPVEAHVDNVYADAQGYINPEYAANVQAAAAKVGGELGAKMASVAQYSTAVWLDRRSAIAGSAGGDDQGRGMGLRAHLDEALAQQTKSGKRTVIQVVIYDAPNRDCSALASNGELLMANNGFNIYKTEYIDPIVAIMKDPKYASLRISTIVEPDSLPNLITNQAAFPKCAEAAGPGGYVDAIAYALKNLRSINNVYTYVDTAHAAWLGWDNNFGPAVQLYAKVAQAAGGFGTIDGFISNTANSNPTKEPFLTATEQIGGQPVRSLANTFDYNNYIDEEGFMTALHGALVRAGFPSSLGMLIDTSRNGWGGPNRPTAKSTSTNLATHVKESIIDKRPHKGNWCNPSGAGLGARPVANPAPLFDAYVWVKPPGESDGASTEIPNDQGKRLDRMCDPTYTGNSLNGNNLTGALPGAPLSGQWFQAQFEMLVANAYPVLGSSPITSPSPRVSPSPQVSVSPSPRVSPSPQVSVSPSPQVSVSPSPQVSVSPSPRVSPSPQVSVSPSPRVSPSPQTSPNPTGCAVSVKVDSSWPNGGQLTVTVKNTTGAAISGWTAGFTLPGTTKVANGWNGTFSQSGQVVTVKNAAYNGSLAAGASTTAGFLVNGTAGAATNFTFNGAAC